MLERKLVWCLKQYFNTFKIIIQNCNKNGFENCAFTR